MGRIELLISSETFADVRYLGLILIIIDYQIRQSDTLPTSMLPVRLFPLP